MGDEGGPGLLGLVPLLLFGGSLTWCLLALRGMRPRTVDTALSPDDVRLVFERSVVRGTWRLADSGEPMVARSSWWWYGGRDRIALRARPGPGRTLATVEVVSYYGWLGVPRNAGAVTRRLRWFVKEVRAKDPTARVVVG